MYKLAIHQSAAEDIQKLALESKTAPVAARVLELAREFRANPAELANLLDHGYRTEDIDVSKFQEFWRQGKDLWRLKFWDAGGKLMTHRIIYAYDVASHRFHFLAVVHREFDYDAKHPTTQRILRDYGEL